MVEQTVKEKVDGKTKPIEDMTLDELDELEDDEDERVLLQYRLVGVREKHCFYNGTKSEF